MKIIGRMLLFCLFFISISVYSQTNLLSCDTNTYVNLELGANYSGSKFGGSCRLSYQINTNIEIGLETDYINGVLYQSSGNGKLGKNFELGKYGDAFVYALSGMGLSFEDKVGNSTGFIGIAGFGTGFCTPPEFKLFGQFESRLTCCFEIDKYSNTDNLVFKQYLGIRVQF